MIAYHPGWLDPDGKPVERRRAWRSRPSTHGPPPRRGRPSCQGPNDSAAFEASIGRSGEVLTPDRAPLVAGDLFIDGSQPGPERLPSQVDVQRAVSGTNQAAAGLLVVPVPLAFGLVTVGALSAR